MKTNIKLSKYFYSFVLFFYFTSVAIAQDDIDPHPWDDDPQDPPPASIDTLWYYLLILGIVFAIYTIKKRKAIQQ